MNKDLKIISLVGFVNRIVYANTSILNSTEYPFYIETHLMKYYTNAAHGFGDPYFAVVRADVITWFNVDKTKLF